MQLRPEQGDRWRPNNGLAEGAEGAGIGQTVTLKFAAPQLVRVVSIAPGWQRTDIPCLFVRNHRPATISARWDDGTSSILAIADVRQVLTFDVSGPPTSALTLTIDDVYPVEACGGHPAVDDTLISEIGIAVDATVPVLPVPTVSTTAEPASSGIWFVRTSTSLPCAAGRARTTSWWDSCLQAHAASK